MNENWTELHGVVLNEIFNSLTNNNIKWLVIRNYRDLPMVNHSADVDIAIKKSDWKISSSLILDIFASKGFAYYELKRYQFILCYTFFDLQGNGFKLDLFDSNEFKGLETHSFDELYKSSIITQHGVRGSSELHNAVIILLRPLLGAGVVKGRYIPEIVECYSRNKEEFAVDLARIFNSQIAELVIGKLNYQDIKSVAKLRTKLKKRLFVTNLRSKGLKAVYLYFNHYLNTLKVRRRLRKSKRFIAVMGADGSGKTTFIDALTSSLAKYYAAHAVEDKCRVYHHRSTMLPNLGSVAEKAKIKEADIDFSRPHRAKPAGFFSSMIRMKYYWVDYLIGGNKILRKDAQFDRFTIFDRYIYDFLVDPYRSRIGLPYWIRKTFTRLVPQPRIVFILATDAKTIYERKQELTLEEIERQLVELRKLAKSSKRFVILDASKSPEQLAQEAITIILDRFTNKL